MQLTGPGAYISQKYIMQIIVSKYKREINILDPYGENYSRTPVMLFNSQNANCLTGRGADVS